MESENRWLKMVIADLRRENAMLKDQIKMLEAESLRRSQMLDDLERDVMVMRGRV